ncbi:MAG: hypothetical protein ACKOXK_05440 [Chakrabartia sp.]
MAQPVFKALRFAGVPLALLLANCGGGETPDPAGLSRDEAEALNDAAEMLDDVNNGQDPPPLNQP